ncbi:AraC family transcriptional regulator [Caulobacter sp. BE254]|uniref:AraC family transcriptional regulator n=1 Tax=Caulobacter sp. BE254 TaxID=2817720 RepID=UPI002866AF26|nr:AraC family transcriptional regulator [Caulobacter sp. BE254]MDR7114354.1 AraC-like DNA-binding protein [Caulobacter sp. BE254]
MTDDLAHSVLRYTDQQSGKSPFATAIAGLTILRSDHPKPLSHMIIKPALCITLQGAKWTAFGERRFDYGAGQALVVGVEMPAVGQVMQASPDQPYLGLVIELDLGVMREVIESLDSAPIALESVRHGVLVSDFEGPLADCAARAVRLLETPQAIALLYPAVMREICYWLLTGPHGGEVVKMALGSDRTRRLVGAIHALRDRYADPVRVDELASIAQLSPSAFHRQFKALTAMTPVQYQKQLRLFEARRLLASGETNVENAAFQVGYESASQFSREYSRMFGASPRRDVASLRRLAA